MKRIIIPALAALMMASCGGNTSKASDSGSVAATEPVVQAVDTVALQAEADSIIRKSLTAYYDSQKKEYVTDKLSEDMYTPEFIKEFTEAQEKCRKQGEAEKHSQGGLLPVVETVPLDILYDNREYGTSDGEETSERGEYKIQKIEFTGLDKATATIKATTRWNYYLYEEDRTEIENKSAIVKIILVKDDSGRWLIDDFEHKGLGSFRKNLKANKSVKVGWAV